MKHILNISNPYELNALFLQPTRWCARNCKGCYAKEHAGGEKGFHLSSWNWMKLFNMFYLNQAVEEGHRAWANQITLAVDDLSLDGYQAAEMLNLFGGILTTVVNRKSNKLDLHPAEFHITCHTPKTLKNYTFLNKKTPWISEERTMEMLKYINMISFSEIPEGEFEFVKEIAKHTPVNYNHLIPANITSDNIDTYVDKVTKIGRIVSHIYLVMFKRPIGSETNELVQLRDRSRMLNDIKVIQTLMERLPEDVRRKVTRDGCLQDVSKHSRTGFGCSSNVSRVQVWPDGSVTGCAYAFGADKPQGRTVEIVMENIRNARKEYDFGSLCHLPEIYDSIHK